MSSSLPTSSNVCHSGSDGASDVPEKGTSDIPSSAWELKQNRVQYAGVEEGRTTPLPRIEDLLIGAGPRDQSDTAYGGLQVSADAPSVCTSCRRSIAPGDRVIWLLNDLEQLEIHCAQHQVPSGVLADQPQADAEESESMRLSGLSPSLDSGLEQSPVGGYSADDEDGDDDDDSDENSSETSLMFHK